MESIFLILAVAGCAAVWYRLLRSAIRAIRQGAYLLYARELAAARARRGDLTGLEEAREWVVRARGEFLRALGSVGIWLAIAVGPLYLSAEPETVYTVYLLLWVLPFGPAAWRARPPDWHPDGEGG